MPCGAGPVLLESEGGAAQAHRRRLPGYKLAESAAWPPPAPPSLGKQAGRGDRVIFSLLFPVGCKKETRKDDGITNLKIPLLLGDMRPVCVRHQSFPAERLHVTRSAHATGGSGGK